MPAPVCEKDGYVLHPDLLNPHLLEAQYAVRGELYLKAEELKKTQDIIYTNGTAAWGLCLPRFNPIWPAWAPARHRGWAVADRRAPHTHQLCPHTI